MEFALLCPVGEQGKAGILGQLSEAETEEQAAHNSGGGQLNNLSLTCHTKYECRVRRFVQTSVATLLIATKKCAIP